MVPLDEPGVEDGRLALTYRRKVAALRIQHYQFIGVIVVLHLDRKAVPAGRTLVRCTDRRRSDGPGQRLASLHRNGRSVAAAQGESPVEGLAAAVGILDLEAVLLPRPDADRKRTG